MIGTLGLYTMYGLFFILDNKKMPMCAPLHHTVLRSIASLMIFTPSDTLVLTSMFRLGQQESMTVI